MVLMHKIEYSDQEKETTNINVWNLHPRQNCQHCQHYQQ
jgi:hypothetical protein